MGKHHPRCFGFKDQEAIEKCFKSYRHSPEKRGALNHHWYTCLLQAENGNIWVGTLDGLHRFDPGTDAFILYQQGLKSPNSLANNTINAIFEDSRGNYGSALQGAGKIQPRHPFL
ncbi:MAG: hypothetical protein H6566_30345 [Lewinellaceae bacterium]|nr:hypothetical protein [Lewinellaceae bacterium]